MFLSRVFRRTLFSAAKSESSAAAAATGYNPLEKFFEVDRNAEDDKPLVYGRSWKASELRLKSWDDLNKLWYVPLKEKKYVDDPTPDASRTEPAVSQPRASSQDEYQVRKSMCRIKHVLTEKAIEEPDPRRSAESKSMINAL